MSYGMPIDVVYSSEVYLRFTVTKQKVNVAAVVITRVKSAVARSPLSPALKILYNTQHKS